MKILSFFLASFCLASVSVHAEDQPLFRMAFDAGQPPGAQLPNMVFQEIERNDNWSTVEAVQAAGSVVAKSMFLMRGSCALLKERQKQAFTIEALSKQPIRFKVHFVSGDAAGVDAAGTPQRTVVSAAKCDAIETLIAP